MDIRYSVLVKSHEFALPKRKELMEKNNEIEVILVDATESPIERPNTKQKILFRQEKNTFNKNSCFGVLKNKKDIANKWYKW